MVLHGIELARPDRWYRAAARDGVFTGYLQISGIRCFLPNYEDIDCCITLSAPGRVRSLSTEEVRYLGAACVIYGPVGFVMGDGGTADEAISNALLRLATEGHDLWKRIACGWLETHPLSPRYCWGKSSGLPNSQWQRELWDD